MVCVEVEVVGDEMVIRGASAGAYDWWGQSPGHLSNGAHLRNLLHADEWYMLEELKDCLQKATTTPSTAAWLSSFEFNVTVCCMTGGHKKGKHRAEPTTYAQARVQVATYSESDVAKSSTAQQGGGSGSSATPGGAVLIFTPLQ